MQGGSTKAQRRVRPALAAVVMLVAVVALAGCKPKPGGGTTTTTQPPVTTTTVAPTTTTTTIDRNSPLGRCVTESQTVRTAAEAAFAQDGIYPVSVDDMVPVYLSRPSTIWDIDTRPDRETLRLVPRPGVTIPDGCVG